MPKLRHLDLRPVTPEERIFGAQSRLKEYMEGIDLIFECSLFSLSVLF